MTLNEALDRLQQEFPGQYTHVYVELKQHTAEGSPRELLWKVYVGGKDDGSQRHEMSAPCPTFLEALVNLKRRLYIDQPEPEEVEV